MTNSRFNPFEKEQQLQDESNSWVTDNAVDALDGDIPVLDLNDFLQTGSKKSLELLSEQLRIACQEVGFFSIIGHQISSEKIQRAFTSVRNFHALPMTSKQRLLIDKHEWPVGGVGYLPFKNRKLPARNNGNLNEAYLIKRDHHISFDDNQWPNEKEIPGFKAAVVDYALALEKLGKQLLPLFACALEMPQDFFEQAFESPTYRLRMTHYPVSEFKNDESFGIAPHVDTTFCTLLAQDQAGLTIYSERKQQWVNAPLVEGAFIVNSGELLRQWTNDRFLSTKHFANNNASDSSRYSIPFFLNANADFVMSCIPSCCSPKNPAKYPPISYSQSQAVVQGE